MDAKLSGTDDQSSPAISLPGSFIFFQAAYDVVFVSLWVHIHACARILCLAYFIWLFMSFVR